MTFKFIEHQADISFIAKAKTKEKLFSECIKAFSDYVSGGKKSLISEKIKFSIKGKDDQELLYKLIEEAIYLMDAKGLLVKSIKAKFSNKTLNGVMDASKIRGSSYVAIKSPTYAEMYVKKFFKGWEACVVLDV